MMWKRWLQRLLAGMLLSGLLAPFANAGTLNVMAFQPSPHQQSLLSVSTTRPAVPFSVYGGLSFHYTDSPMQFAGATGDGRFLVEQAVKNRLMGEVLFSFAPATWLDVGVAMPLVLMGEGASLMTRFSEVGDTGGFHVGEARANVKATLYRTRKFGIGIQADTTLPTGDVEGLVSNGLGYGGRLVTDFRAGPLTIALNAGAYLRAEPSTITCDRQQGLLLGFSLCGTTDTATGVVDDTLLEVGNELVGGLGAEFPINQKMTVLAEAYLRTALDDPMGETASNQMEAMGAIRYQAADWMQVSVGGGGGTALSKVESLNLLGYGTSRFRVFADVKMVGQLYMDTDDDGVGDGDDACPYIPEDEDGFLDEDGCPEPDNDDDGFLDVSDECPNDPEDADGFQDDDGCPEVDNDQDTLPDEQDQCPMEAEDPDGFEDEDGCPEHDNDGDGIDDKVDKCVYEKETVNGFQDEDGCRDFPGVALVDNRFVLGEKIRFDYPSQEVAASSFQILRDFARFLDENQDWTRIRIDVHTDGVSPPAEQRARTETRVEELRMFLIMEGVAPSRLDLHSIGGFRPIAGNDTAEGREENNRVEIFVIRGE